MYLKSILLSGTLLVQASALLAKSDSEYISDLERAKLSHKALIDSDAGTGGTSIRYQSYAASGMSNIRSTDFSYGGGGCLISGQSYLGVDQQIDLPHGSRIVSASFLVDDNSTLQSTTGLLFEGGATFNDFFQDSTTSVDTPGNVSIGGFLDYTLTDSTKFITARLELSGTDNATICGVRIGYITPDVASDVIFTSNFYR